MVEEEEEARPKIHEYLSKPGVKDVLRRFSDKFNQEVGTQYIYGMTSDGLVVAVRARCSEDVKSNDYYKAWVLDTKLSPDEIENSMISTSFHGINVSTVGNNADFPFNRGTATLLSDEEIKQRIFPPSNTQLIEFYKKISLGDIKKVAAEFIKKENILLGAIGRVDNDQLSSLL